MYIIDSSSKFKNNVNLYFYLLYSVHDLDRQLILTKDNITVNIDTCVYYRIVDAKLAYYSVESIMQSVSEVTYATLRTICGENTLQDLLEKRQ
jgi:erythrocyte band 7 integral membrane protein